MGRSGRRLLATLLLVLFVGGTVAHADSILLRVRDVPEHGLVVAPVDLTGAARWCKIAAVTPESVRAVDANDRLVPCQFVPDPDFDGSERLAGTVVLQLPPGSDGQLRLSFDGNGKPTAPPFDGTVRTKNYGVVHQADRLGGFPSKITFAESGKVFDSLRWHDRTYHAEQGSYRLIDDGEAKVRTGCRRAAVHGRSRGRTLSARQGTSPQANLRPSINGSTSTTGRWFMSPRSRNSRNHSPGKSGTSWN